MKFKSLLKEMRFGLPQVAGNMVVIPIVSDTQNVEISEDMLFNISSDSSYESLTLSNDDTKPVIVPQGASYINKQTAQDRAVLSAEVIEVNKSKVVNVSCIQSSQGGHMSTGTKEFRFIPATLRIKAIEKDEHSSHSEYSLLWKDIEEYKKLVGLDGRAHMSDFYEKFEKSLEEFIAPFERIEKQIGAVVFINNKIAGVEIYPNYKSWNNVWKKLIRDTYGSEAIAFIKNKRAVALRPKINIDNVTDFDSLEVEAKTVINDITNNLKEIIDVVIEEDVEETEVNKVGTYIINNLLTHTFIGQYIKTGEDIVYVTAMHSSIK